MKLVTFISAATAMIAAASAERSAPELNKACDHNKAYARVINRCSYPVYLWSVAKGTGCPTDGMVTLETGESYSENYLSSTDSTGVSIKISKSEICKGEDIVQLEYFLEENNTLYEGNYLDVSYVDCLGDACPTRSEGFYLVAGNQTGKSTASSGNTWCPILSCSDAASCSKLAYVLPDDVQTKTCNVDSNMDFYMCGSHAPTEDYPSPASSAASSKKPKSSAVAATSVKDSYKVNAAAVTSAPVKDVVEKAQKQNIKTEVVYVTAVEYVNAKRHAHGHARRHQPFNA